ncbi:MAG: WD40 repeat domain-containing protein [Rhodospirillaceae bacterium]|nr:WD40 repeat domain-containing protein [Rhodospirillaceae bacterium]
MALDADEPLVRSRGLTWSLGAYIVGAAATPDGRYIGIGLGDGNVGVLDLTDAAAGFKLHAAHDGASLSFCADVAANAFLSGGDDGRLVKVTVDGRSEELAKAKGRWIEHVAATRETGLRVYAAGKVATVLDAKGKAAPRELTHDSSVGGLAINPKGRRLAVSHYGGVSLWWLAARDGAAQLLPWKGSHLQVTWSPDGTYVCTAMQENSVHGWRLSDGEHFRMQGYAAKVRALSFTRRGQFMATGGADTIICWPFTGGGPMGKAPTEFGGPMNGPPATCVAANPKLDVVAAGYEDGRVIIGQPGSHKVIAVCGPHPDKDGAAVTALAWTPAGDRLFAGAEAGTAHIVDFRALLS